MANDRIGKPQQKMQSLRPAAKRQTNASAPKTGVANAMVNQLQRAQDKTARPGDRIGSASPRRMPSSGRG